MCDTTIQMYCYRISLGYNVILVLQPKLSLKTHFHACFNNHVTLHVTRKFDEWPTAYIQRNLNNITVSYGILHS